MKKFAAMLIATAMFFACCGAFADDAVLDIKPEDFTLDLSETHMLEVKIGAAASFADANADTVTKEESVTKVIHGDVTMTLDLAEHPTVLCFTQDIYASFDAYLQSNDPQKLVQWLVDNQISFFLYDMETELQDYLYCQGSDSLSTMVGTLSLLSEANKQAVADCIGAERYVEAGGQTWLVAPTCAKLVTIFKNQYYIVEYLGTDDAEADLEDTLTLLDHMTFE